MSTLDPLESDILDEIYFMTPFADIVSATSHPAPKVATVLARLMEKRYVWQMHYDEGAHDFVKSDNPDHEHMDRYHYLATKEGLMAHNL